MADKERESDREETYKQRRITMVKRGVSRKKKDRHTHAEREKERERESENESV